MWISLYTGHKRRWGWAHRGGRGSRGWSSASIAAHHCLQPRSNDRGYQQTGGRFPVFLICQHHEPGEAWLIEDKGSVTLSLCQGKRLFHSREQQTRESLWPTDQYSQELSHGSLMNVLRCTATFTFSQDKTSRSTKCWTKTCPIAIL